MHLLYSHCLTKHLTKADYLHQTGMGIAARRAVLARLAFHLLLHSLRFLDHPCLRRSHALEDDLGHLIAADVVVGAEGAVGEAANHAFVRRSFDTDEEDI
jgi:hypothetical protein